MRTYNIDDLEHGRGLDEGDYIVRQFDCNSMPVHIHKLAAASDADAVDLACIMIGADRAHVWQHERFVYEILPASLRREPDGG